jgi:hypothetical protein
VPEEFTLSIVYKETQQEIPCRLRVSAYTYQFLCTIGDLEWILEKDDAGNVRALAADSFAKTSQKTDPGLVKAVVEEMERILQ